MIIVFSWVWRMRMNENEEETDKEKWKNESDEGRKRLKSKGIDEEKKGREKVIWTSFGKEILHLEITVCVKSVFYWKRWRGKNETELRFSI